MSTNDHTVPQMYLRRFAERKGSRYFICARRVEALDDTLRTNVRNVTAVNGFYWGTAPDGVPHHDAERLLAQIESDATPIFGTLLDDPLYAYSLRWPLRPEERAVMAWWMSAQLLRTTRQRKRLAHLAAGAALEAPASIRSVIESNRHLNFMSQQIAALAAVLAHRPWALGFSDACLLTGDVPVGILNGHDEPHQTMSASLLDIVLPLDPHRFLFMPEVATQEQDPRKRIDHRMKLDGGLGTALSHVLHDAADAFVLHHPRHPPPVDRLRDGPRLPNPWAGDSHTAPEYFISYNVLAADANVERHWIDKHPGKSTGP
jgi:hypothetical protein